MGLVQCEVHARRSCLTQPRGQIYGILWKRRKKDCGIKGVKDIIRIQSTESSHRVIGAHRDLFHYQGVYMGLT